MDTSQDRAAVAAAQRQAEAAELGRRTPGTAARQVADTLPPRARLPEPVNLGGAPAQAGPGCGGADAGDHRA